MTYTAIFVAVGSTGRSDFFLFQYVLGQATGFAQFVTEWTAKPTPRSLLRMGVKGYERAMEQERFRREGWRGLLSDHRRRALAVVFRRCRGF